jgi:transcriptional regulator with XRE-family HTH domain
MSPLNLSLARAVRHLRSAAGFSQEAFAAKVKIHRTFMSSIERGKTNVSLETIERLAAGLDMPVWRLIRRAETEAGAHGKVAENEAPGRAPP